MRRNRNYNRKFALLIILALAAIIMMNAAKSEESKTKYNDLEKEQLDEASGEALKEYYGEVLGAIGKGGKTKFNTMATKDSIAIINITINGKDRRILTRLNTGMLFPSQLNITNADLIRTVNIVALGNISVGGILYSPVQTSFGARRFFSSESSTLRYTDDGFSRLADGKANISINPILAELIDSYSIFLSPEGLTRGIYVAEKTSSYFVVRSINAKSNIAFSWMIRGTRKNLHEHLSAQENSSIKITAIIDYENSSAYVTVSGLANNSLDAIPTLQNESEGNHTDNQTNESSPSLITGNAVLEEDLSAILGDTPQQLPDLSQQPPENIENLSNQTNEAPQAEPPNAQNNSESIPPLIPKTYTLRFTLSTTNEQKILQETASLSGLGVSGVKKLVSFVYKAPEHYIDETIEEGQSPALDYIQKVNGSVIIKLG